MNQFSRLYRHTLSVFALLGVPSRVFAAAAGGGADARMIDDKVDLLEPIGGPTEIDVGPGLTTWYNYFNSALPWLYTVAVGLCLLWMLYGGYLIMISSDQADKRAAGKAKMIGAILGIVVLSFTGSILRILNDMFFD